MKQQDKLKQAVAIAAVDYIPSGCVLGVGTGSTVDHFIQQLATIKSRIDACVASSERSAKQLRELGFEVVDLNQAGSLSLYIDGADEVNALGHMIKGGGGALTREKIVAAASEKFICLVDESKLVTNLGEFPLAIEVIPMARSYVARQLRTLGASPDYRVGFVTDNGNQILDTYSLDYTDALTLETTLNNITGTVCNGLFAQKPANTVLIAKPNGVEVMQPNL